MALVYLSGPITNVPNYRQEFESFANVFERLGYVVINPVHIADCLIGINKLTEEEIWSKEWRKIFLLEDVKAMLDCDLVVMLPNWKHSKGAKLEHKIAKMLNMEIIYV